MVKRSVDLLHPGMGQLLTSETMQRLVESVAEEVAERAHGRGVMVEGEPGDVPIPVTVQSAKGRTRARALVVLDHPAGEAVESQHRLLGGSLG